MLSKKVLGATGASAAVLLGIATTAMASPSGGISLDTGQSVSFSGSYRYGVAMSGSSAKGVLVAGTLKSAKSNSGHLNARQQGYSWTQLAHVNIGSTSGVNHIVSPGDTMRAADLRVQVCAEHWYGDKCVEGYYPE